MAGEWQRGRELVERALARDPAYSGYCHAVLALIAYMQRDGDRAEAEIRQANLTKFSFYHAIAAVIYAERGLMAERAGRPPSSRSSTPRSSQTWMWNCANATCGPRIARAWSGPAQGGCAGARGSIGRGQVGRPAVHERSPPEHARTVAYCILRHPRPVRP